MTILATSLVNWSALQKIIVVALIGGAGVVLAFGLLLIGVKWATRAKSGRAKFGGLTLAGLGALFCIATVVIGIVAMADKPSSKKPAKKPAAALIHRPSSSGRAASGTD
jgi:hypothetical protein